MLFLNLLNDQLSKKNFTMLLAVLVGLSTGLVAVFLKIAVHLVYTFATQNKLADNYYIALFLPFIGIVLTYLIIQKGLKGVLIKGLARLHLNIAQGESIVPSQQMYAQVVTSAVTVGFGGSAGLEAPIVITGAAIGSNYAQYFNLNYAERTLLLACGVAAGIGAAFNAPIAGVLFTIEVLMLEITTTGFIPLLIAAATGALMSKMILNEGVLLSFQLQQPFNYTNVPFYIVLGGLAGLVSVYHARMFARVEKIFSRFANTPILRMIIAGMVLAILIAVFPSLFGEGYNSIKNLALMKPQDLSKNSIFENNLTNDGLLLLFLTFVMFFKAIATGVTLGGGGNGGNFAPSLFVGSYLGFIYSKFINFMQIGTVPISNFTIVAMAGVLSGIYHAPLTAIFLIAELTGGYALIIPLMIVSSISYFVSKSIEPYTMDTKQFAATKKILSQDKDNNVLITMKIEDIVETNFVALKMTDYIEDLVNAIIASERNIFPVVDNENKLLGIILLNDIKNIVFKKNLYTHIQVKDIMQPYPDAIHLKDGMATVVKKFDKTQAWNLPVVDDNGYLGFISKSKLFSDYRNELINRTIN